LAIGIFFLARSNNVKEEEFMAKLDYKITLKASLLEGFYLGGGILISSDK